MLKHIHTLVLMLTAMLLCHSTYAAPDKVEDSAAVKVIESGKKTRRLEGATLKIARPILKKTPMVAVMDDIEMMMHCPVDKISRKDHGEFAGKGLHSSEQMMELEVLLKTTIQNTASTMYSGCASRTPSEDA